MKNTGAPDVRFAIVNLSMLASAGRQRRSRRPGGPHAFHGSARRLGTTTIDTKNGSGMAQVRTQPLIIVFPAPDTYEITP